VGAPCFRRGNERFSVEGKKFDIVVRFSAGLYNPGLKSLHFNSRIWEARGAHRRSLDFARDDNFVWER
jgi:hypothetical protein